MADGAGCAASAVADGEAAAEADGFAVADGVGFVAETDGAGAGFVAGGGVVLPSVPGSGLVSCGGVGWEVSAGRVRCWPGWIRSGSVNVPPPGIGRSLFRSKISPYRSASPSCASAMPARLSPLLTVYVVRVSVQIPCIFAV
ncbi:hypothetical protein [Streptomyces sp. Mg1]|uniref:hypothetical protein n=1 Tax=Streptomyces sp. Mg1 TaxID=465541 RepID=UPI00131A0461|nr:hypothetical protein [Streptomyces sp. Mg1]